MVEHAVKSGTLFKNLNCGFRFLENQRWRGHRFAHNGANE